MEDVIRQAPDASKGSAANGDPIGRFLAWAERDPDRPAVDMAGAITTYGQLETAARRFAACFAGVAAPRVLIALPPGVEAYAAIIGTILGGGCYVPVNVATPANKLARVAEVIQPDAVVAASPLAADLAAASAALVVAPERSADAPPLEGPGARGPTAYVIMTSGSTGTPKGVVISTAALAHYIDWISDSDLFGPTDRASQFHHIGFDVHVLDIYGALSAGATLAPPTEPADRLFPADFIRRARISVWGSVPSAIDIMISGRQATGAMLESVRRFVLCGEPLRRSHLAAIFAACPDAEVMNLYGPTEATVTVTSVRLRAADPLPDGVDSITLGEPIADMDLRLIGGAHPDEGEIVITGPQLATEYWRDPERTAKAFRPVSVGGDTVRGYFTGDWGQRVGGRLYFKGRIDRQIKIRGYRIETGEIVARLADAGWPVACVMKRGEVLAAVVEAADGRPFDPAALRVRLRDELEPHAVPDVILAIPGMPRNSNGKLDENAVRAWLDQIPMSRHYAMAAADDASEA